MLLQIYIFFGIFHTSLTNYALELTWSHQENDNTAVINDEGYTTMIANANIGYIHVEDQATYRIIGDLYLLGTANGKSAWFPYGPKFNYDANAGEYYIDVYFKGYNVDSNAEDGYGYFTQGLSFRCLCRQGPLLHRPLSLWQGQLQ